jgi:hypothetical protein
MSLVSLSLCLAVPLSVSIFPSVSLCYPYENDTHSQTHVGTETTSNQTMSLFFPKCFVSPLLIPFMAQSHKTFLFRNRSFTFAKFVRKNISESSDVMSPSLLALAIDRNRNDPICVAPPKVEKASSVVTVYDALFFQNVLSPHS